MLGDLKRFSFYKGELNFIDLSEFNKYYLLKRIVSCKSKLFFIKINRYFKRLRSFSCLTFLSFSLHLSAQTGSPDSTDFSGRLIVQYSEDYVGHFYGSSNNLLGGTSRLIELQDSENNQTVLNLEVAQVQNIFPLTHNLTDVLPESDIQKHFLSLRPGEFQLTKVPPYEIELSSQQTDYLMLFLENCYVSSRKYEKQTTSEYLRSLNGLGIRLSSTALNVLYTLLLTRFEQTSFGETLVFSDNHGNEFRYRVLSDYSLASVSGTPLCSGVDDGVKDYFNQLLEQVSQDDEMAVTLNVLVNKRIRYDVNKRELLSMIPVTYPSQPTTPTPTPTPTPTSTSSYIASSAAGLLVAVLFEGVFIGMLTPPLIYLCTWIFCPDAFSNLFDRMKKRILASKKTNPDASNTELIRYSRSRRFDPGEFTFTQDKLPQEQVVDNQIPNLDLDESTFVISRLPRENIVDQVAKPPCTTSSSPALVVEVEVHAEHSSAAAGGFPEGPGGSSTSTAVKNEDEKDKEDKVNKDGEDFSSL